jgi:hypothetical protein
MLGGNLSQLVSNEHGVVVRSTGALTILDSATLQKRCSIWTQSLEFTVVDHQLIVLTSPQEIKQYHIIINIKLPPP